jgi:hypothetical protein
MNVQLDQAKLNEIQSLLNRLPIETLPIVQKIVEILNSGVQQSEEKE